MSTFTAVLLAALGIAVAAILGWALTFDHRRLEEFRQFARRYDARLERHDPHDLQSRLDALLDERSRFVGRSARLSDDPSTFALDLHAEVGRRATENALLVAIDGASRGGIRSRLPDHRPSDSPDFDEVFETDGEVDALLETNRRGKLADEVVDRDWMVEIRWADGWLLVRRLDGVLQDSDEWQGLLELARRASS